MERRGRRDPLMSAAFAPGLDPNEPTALSFVGTYDEAAIEAAVRAQFDALGISSMFCGKKVAVKPNLVMKKDPSAAATTHPAVLAAVLRILKETAAEILIAESPGGVYSETSLRSVYRVCGLADVSEAVGVPLNYDVSSRETDAPDGKVSKTFEIISPILDADVIVNLCKLKSHSLTGYSGAVKNYFGTIPGVRKFEMHARFPDYQDFGGMLCDLCAFHVGSKPTFNLIDGIVAMEGNGPTGGDPKPVGVLIGGRNPFCADRVGAHIIGAEKIIMLDEGTARGYCPEKASDVKLIFPDGGEKPVDELAVPDFRQPDARSRETLGVTALRILPGAFGGKLNEWFRPRPEIDRKTCVGCGECARSCPQKTIRMEKKKDGKRVAAISYDVCIRCFCCQELCPQKAVKIHQNPILRLIAH